MPLDFIIKVFIIIGAFFVVSLCILIVYIYIYNYVNTKISFNLNHNSQKTMIKIHI